MLLREPRMRKSWGRLASPRLNLHRHETIFLPCLQMFLVVPDSMNTSIYRSVASPYVRLSIHSCTPGAMSAHCASSQKLVRACFGHFQMFHGFASLASWKVSSTSLGNVTIDRVPALVRCSDASSEDSSTPQSRLYRRSSVKMGVARLAGSMMG